MLLETARFCAIDVETTGLDPEKDEIVALACVPLSRLRIMVGDIFYTLIRPERYTFKAMKYHGISKGDLANAPTFGEAAEEILTVLDGVLVGHCVDFDFEFIRKRFRTAGVKFKRDRIDIALIEGWLRQKRGIDDADLGLNAMMHSYGLKQHYRHNASADAFFAAQIFQIQMKEMMARGIDSLEQVIKTAKRCTYADRGFF